jgi:hypothetical protein
MSQTPQYVVEEYSGRLCTNACCSVHSSELAVNNGDNKQDKNGYNGNGNDAVRSHAATR